MATLIIRDGSPHWWNSPDIWVVPGNDPNGLPGPPVEGEPAFLWARVQSLDSEQQVNGAVVNFYWSNPATGVLRSNSTLVGSGFVDLSPGETQEVLCIIPWVPVVVNSGHECVVAEVIHYLDPLPSPLPDNFDPPNYHQVAQKNLTVMVLKKGKTMTTIQVAAPARKAQELVLTTQIGGDLDPQNLKQLGLEKYRPAKGGGIHAVLSLDPVCDESDPQQMEKEIRISLKPGGVKPVFLKVENRNLERGYYELLNVISREGKEILGGITYVVINKE